MGLGPDEIQVILGAATLFLELCHSLRSWLKARQGTSQVVMWVDDAQQAAQAAQLFGPSVEIRIRPRPVADDSEGRQDPS